MHAAEVEQRKKEYKKEKIFDKIRNKGKRV